jgi:gluconolactonase
MITKLLEGLDFPESPVWSQQDNCLYFVEWTGNRLSAWRDGHFSKIFNLVEPGGPSGMAQDKDGNFWLCLYDACALGKFSPDGTKLIWIDAWGEQSFRGVCDLALDDQGGIYFSDSGNFEDDWTTGRPAGAIYYLNPVGELIKVESNLRYPNGLALSPQNDYLYVNEHRANRTLRYSINEGGKLSDRCVFFELDDNCMLETEKCFELGPDGNCIDDWGNLYLAHYGGGKVVIIKPDGTEGGQIHLPSGFMPTSCCYNPEQNALYVTEAQVGILYKVDMDAFLVSSKL